MAPVSDVVRDPTAPVRSPFADNTASPDSTGPTVPAAVARSGGILDADPANPILPGAPDETVPQAVRDALENASPPNWAGVTALLDGADILHVDGCPCGNCSFKDESLTQIDNGTVEGSVTGTANAGILGDMADFLLTGYWNTGYGDGTRSHNVTSSGTDANNGVLHYNLSGYSADADGLTAARATLVRESFKLFEATLGIQFVETTSTDTNFVDFFFRDNDSGAYASHSYYNSGAWGSTIHYAQINVAQSWSGGTSTYDDYTLQTILHEIGHALGLGHQGPYNGSATYGVDNTFDNDSWQASMMSYFSQTENSTINASYEFLQTPMSVDWMALDTIYGRQGYGVSNAFTGDTVYGFNTNITSEVSDIWANFASFGNRTASTIVDGAGNDTLDLSGYGNNSVINLAPSDSGSTTPSLSDIGGRVGNLSIAEGTIIENAIGGAGSEVFYGNVADNTMTGNGGNDIFYDSVGADTYLGGDGSDTVIFGGDFFSYTFSLAGSFLQVINAAVDLVESSIEWLTFSDQTKSFTEIADGLVANTAPVAAGDAFSVAEDQILNGAGLLSNDSDADGDALTVGAVNGISVTSDPGGTQVSLASGAILTIFADGTFSYDQNGAFDALNVGQQDTDSFTYTASDGLTASNPATVTITIDGAFDNTVPVATDDSVTTGEASAVSGNVLTNDSDVDGDALAVTAVNGSQASVGSQITLASGALLTLRADGTFDYDPNGAFDGLVSGQTGIDGFSYTVSDGAGGSSTATVAITIDGVSPPVTARPIVIDFEASMVGATYAGQDGLAIAGIDVTSGNALSGNYGVSNGFTITTTEGDFDLDALSARSAGGRVRIEAAAYDDGVLVGTSVINVRTNKVTTTGFNTSFDSVDEVIFTANGSFYIDDIALLTRAEVVPGAPTALDDTLMTDEATTVSGDLLLNDTDPDGDALSLTSVEGESGGSVMLTSGAIVTFASDGTVFYDPNGQFDALYAGQEATDSFSYEISDGNGGTSTAQATVTIAGIGTPPPEPTTVLFDFENGLSADGFVFNDTALVSGRDALRGTQSGQSIGDTLMVTRSDGQDFDLEDALFRAVSGKRVTLNVEGYDDGVLVATDRLNIRDNRDTSHTFDSPLFDKVDAVLFTANGGLVLDDLTFLT